MIQKLKFVSQQQHYQTFQSIIFSLPKNNKTSVPNTLRQPAATNVYKYKQQNILSIFKNNKLRTIKTDKNCQPIAIAEIL